MTVEMVKNQSSFLFSVAFPEGWSLFYSSSGLSASPPRLLFFMGLPNGGILHMRGALWVTADVLWEFRVEYSLGFSFSLWKTRLQAHGRGNLDWGPEVRTLKVYNFLPLITWMWDLLILIAKSVWVAPMVVPNTALSCPSWYPCYPAPWFAVCSWESWQCPALTSASGPW